MQSSRDDRLGRTLDNDDVIASFPDEDTHDAVENTDSPLDCEAKTASSTLQSVRMSPFGQVPYGGLLDDLYASSVFFLTWAVFLTCIIGPRSISTNCIMERLCCTDHGSYRRICHIIYVHQCICDM